jgi:hypothetical protein
MHDLRAKFIIEVERATFVSMLAMCVMNFCDDWNLLADNGQCDELGGAEFRRVLAAWIAANCPDPRQQFILTTVNIQPGRNIHSVEQLRNG